MEQNTNPEPIRVQNQPQTQTPVQQPDQTATPQPQVPKKKKSKKKILLLLLFLIIVAAGILIWWFFFNKTVQKPEQSGFKGELSIIDNPELEKDKEVSKMVGPAGDVLTTRASDGTLYTLTVPPESMTVPLTITMTPLKEVPFSNYSQTDAGKGVWIGEKVTFNRPAYLTIQPNTEEPKKDSPSKAVNWGRCAVGSRGYDPEICAGIRKLPYGVGVAPGKVVLLGSKEFSTIVLNPTVPTGIKNDYNTMVWRSGYYLADKINKIEADQLVKKTYSKSYDTVNESEVLMQLAALGGDVNAYKDEIKKFERAKKDYPREVLKQAIVAKIAKEDTAYSKRIEDFKTIFEKNASKGRGAFLPLPRYTALARQIKAQSKKTSSNDSGKNNELIAIANAQELPDYDPSSGNQEESNPGDDLPWYDSGKEETGDNLPWYEGDNVWPDSEEDSSDYNPDETFPNDLPDYVEDPADKTSDDAGKEIDDGSKATAQHLRDIIGTSIYSCTEKVEAAEALLLMGAATASDIQSIQSILNKCANKCTTFEECEKINDAAGKYGASDASAAALYRIKIFLEKGGDCKDAVHKDLSTYGIQCQSTDSGKKE